jgi:hypothetical protein
MPCYAPLQAYVPTEKDAEGKRRPYFTYDPKRDSVETRVPCRNCIGCRIRRSCDWGIRCVHEASLYENNCFITLTYRDECLPPNYELVHYDWQCFMKRLRDKFGNGIKAFMCGEYGEKYKRPHFHAILFNVDFDDKRIIAAKKDYVLYGSQTLDDLWMRGFTSVGTCNFTTAAYVAKYVTKKATGKAAFEEYGYVSEDGEILLRKPPYSQAPRLEGLGLQWLQQHIEDVFPRDYIVHSGARFPVPRYYFDKAKELRPDLMEEVEHNRLVYSLYFSEDESYKRLMTIEKVKEAQLMRSLRDFE